LVKTDSAVDKPHLKQQFTDPTSNSNGESLASCQNLVDNSLEKKESINDPPRQTVIQEVPDEASKNETDEYM
jgi:hypothetical protein